MRLVFLIDVDNTLLDNDRLKEDLATALVRAVGSRTAAVFWDVYESVRVEKEYVDFVETINRLAASQNNPALADQIWTVLNAIPFSEYLFPDAIAVLHHLGSMGTTVILSDGDSVFQPRKIRESGIGQAVQDRILIYVHKEMELPDLFEHYPAEHYVAIDDKPRIIDALEACCPSTFTTVLVRQGQYGAADYGKSPADYSIDSIGDLLAFRRSQFLPRAASAAES